MPSPVVRLDTLTFAMHPVSPSGPPPGWLWEHTAALSPDLQTVVVSGGKLEIEAHDGRRFVDNPDDWALDVAKWSWTRLTDRRWEQWELRREDGRGNHLWQRDLAYRFGIGKSATDRQFFAPLGDEKSFLANRPLHESRYSPPFSHEKLPDGEGVPLVIRRVVEDVVVRYVEDSDAVDIVIEGTLDRAVVEAIVGDACDKLGRLEGVTYVRRRLA